MNAPTLIVLLILAALAVLAIRSLVKKPTCACGMNPADCPGCSAGCAPTQATGKKSKRQARGTKMSR